MFEDLEDSYHYAVIARAIAILDRSADGRISLSELAAEMHMSPSHFQRVFSRWAGVSPKRFQQYLQLNHAKALLRNRCTVLEATHSLGLTGASRLHDLFVRWEAMSPGEFAIRGRGVKILYGWFDSPFGPMLAMGTNRGLCGIGFSTSFGRQETFSDLASRWEKASFAKDTGHLAGWVDPIIRQSGETRIVLSGGPFQIKVWEALLCIPSGHVSTYSNIARSIGNPKAVRAVGTAVGRNPLSWLIPCHRVIRKTGALGGYHWGINVKRALLAREAVRYDVDVTPVSTGVHN